MKFLQMDFRAQQQPQHQLLKYTPQVCSEVVKSREPHEKTDNYLTWVNEKNCCYSEL